MNTVAHALQRVCTSQVNYWLSLVFDSAAAITLVGLGVIRVSDPLAAFITFVVGAFIFTFIEYGLHRWLFHCAYFAAIHHAHHVSPHQPAAMPFFCAPLGAELIWLATSELLGEEAGCFLTAGITSAYVYYGVLHHLQHRVRSHALPLRWMKARWRDHAIHHARVDRNYGVITSFWDRVFGTWAGAARRGNAVRKHGVPLRNPRALS